MERRRDMFEEATCTACEETYDREIGSCQELCLSCLTRSYELRNENLSRNKKDLETSLKVGPTLTALKTDDERGYFLRRLSAIRRLRGIPEIAWEFLLEYDSSCDDEVVKCPEVNLLALFRRRRFQAWMGHQ